MCVCVMCGCVWVVRGCDVWVVRVCDVWVVRGCDVWVVRVCDVWVVLFTKALSSICQGP